MTEKDSGADRRFSGDSVPAVPAADRLRRATDWPSVPAATDSEVAPLRAPEPAVAYRDAVATVLVLLLGGSPARALDGVEEAGAETADPDVPWPGPVASALARTLETAVPANAASRPVPFVSVLDALGLAIAAAQSGVASGRVSAPGAVPALPAITG